MISWLPALLLLAVFSVKTTSTTATPAAASSAASSSTSQPRPLEAAWLVGGQVVGRAGGSSGSGSPEGGQAGESRAAHESQALVGQTSERVWSSELSAGGGSGGEKKSLGSKSHSGPIYTNQFVIEVRGGELEARKLAEKHGFVYLNHILGNYYHLEHRRLSKRSTSADQGALNITIESEPQVLLLERQVLKRRVKRDFIDLPGPTFGPATTNSAERLQPPQLHMHGRGQPQQLPSHQQQQSVVRPANQRAQVAAGLPAHQHLRPASPPPHSPTVQPAATPTHQFTWPANQAQPEAASGGGSRVAFPQRLLGQQLQQQSQGQAPRLGAAPAAAKLSEQPVTEGRTMELLESAATSATLLYQQAVASAPGGGALQMQAPGRPRPQAANGTAGGLATAASSANGTYGSPNRPPAPFNDPSWPLMWYLDGGAKNGFDLNVMAAWKMGYTGKGIVITILDDGLEKDHPDLQANYDPLASFDINGDDADPMPRYDVNDSNRHGTRCAGEVAAVPDNNICSVGIAYNSKVGGVRMLDGDVTDAVEARSLGLNNQHIHIYSASWGPDDNGKTVDGPGEMATRAFIEGVTNGRQGLGSIFVFASGNGGREHDNCNCDGYTNSIWTLSISSATENGYVPWYIEACSSTLATTYSSGSYEERQIATTDLHHSCTSSHTGTSASAPLAAGICALVLESNPKLTWRDMQHIVVRTAKPANLVAKDWRTNAMGRNVSHAFGYGLMDAAAMINMAKRWTTVPVQYTCEVKSPQMEKFIPAKGYIELKLSAKCFNVTYLEHVQSKVTLTSSRRGDLHIYLISPHGTRSTLLAQRPNDQADQGFRNWPFMTVHSWGESPNGVWTLEVHNDGKPQNRAYLKEWTLILHGTHEDPNQHLDPLTAGSQALTHTQGTTAANNNNNKPHQVHAHSGHAPPSPSASFPRPPTPVSGPPPSGSQPGRQPATTPTTPGGGGGSGPPPPLPAIPSSSGQGQSNQGEGGGVSETSRQQANGRPSSHWGYSSQAPLPPPLKQPPEGTASSSGGTNWPPTSAPPQTSTSTSSYVTTFKTLVSTSSTAAPPPPPSNDVHLAHQQQAHQGAGRFQVNSDLGSAGRGQAPKADFEVVSPPSVASSEASNVPPSFIQANGSHQYEQPNLATGSSIRPPINSDNNNDKFHNSHLFPKPPVGEFDLQQRPVNTQATTSIPAQGNELDGNQIDSKQTKDYRSSGDQSIYSSTPNTDLLLPANEVASSGASGEISMNAILIYAAPLMGALIHLFYLRQGLCPAQQLTY